MNERMHLAFIASGLIPEQYKKFSNFGCIRTVSSSNLEEKMPQFEGCVEALVQESIHQTIQEDQTESEEVDIELVWNLAYRPDLNGIELVWR